MWSILIQLKGAEIDTAFAVVFIDVIQNCFCIVIYRHNGWSVVLVLSSLKTVFWTVFYVLLQKKKIYEAFAICRGLVIENPSVQQRNKKKFILRNVSFLLTIDFSPILLFFPTALCDKHWGYWLKRNSFVANVIPCSACELFCMQGRQKHWFFTVTQRYYI